MRGCKQKGSAVLLMSVIILVGLGILSLIAVNYAKTEQKIYSNRYQIEQAFEAAEAGMDFAILYVNENPSLVTADSDGDGFVDASPLTQTLADNAMFSAVFENPTQNDFFTLKVTSTGTSPDGSATRAIEQLITLAPIKPFDPNVPLTSAYPIELAGTAGVTNTFGDTTIWSGGTVELEGDAATYTVSGEASNADVDGGDINASDSSLAALTEEEFFVNFFGMTAENLSNIADVSLVDYNGSYSQAIDGEVGKVIFLENTDGSVIDLVGNLSIGTAAEPVLLIVNSPIKISGDVAIYGTLYIAGDWDAGGGEVIVDGSILSYGGIDLGSNVQVNYDPAILATVSNLGLSVRSISGWNDLNG